MQDSDIFSYIKDSVSKRYFKKYKHVSFIRDDLGEIENTVNFKVWKQKERLKEETYKNYINRSVSNTFKNYLRNRLYRIKLENKVPFLTKINDYNQMEIFPDVIDSNESFREIVINFNDFTKKLKPNELKVFNYLKQNVTVKATIAIEMGLSRRQVNKIVVKIKNKLKSYRNSHDE